VPSMLPKIITQGYKVTPCPYSQVEFLQRFCESDSGLFDWMRRP
jgi:hypothetical protein